MTETECEEECKRDQRNFRNFLLILQFIFFILRIIPNDSDIYKNPWSWGEVFIPGIIGVSIYSLYILFCCYASTANYEPPPQINNQELQNSLTNDKSTIVI